MTLRRHRLPRGYPGRRLQYSGSSRAVFHPTGHPIVVNDFTGNQLLRIGAYGLDNEQDDRGMVILDSGDITIGEFSQGQGISFGNPIIGSVQSDNIVTIGRTTVQQFIDFTNGSDSNDGKAPKSLADTFATVGNLDGRVMSDTYHTWKILQGTAANATTVAGPAVSMVVGANALITASAQAGGMFDEQKINFQMDKVPTVANARVLLFFRLLNKGTWATNQQGYGIRIVLAPGAVVPTQSVVTMVDGTTTSIAGPTANTDAQTFAANTDWTVRAQCYYNYLTKTTTIRSKCWKSSGTEPTTWEVSTTNTNDALLQRGGAVGFGVDNNAIGNPNITTKFSSWSYQLLDPDLIASDDTSATASAIYYVPDSASGPVQSLSAALRAFPSYVSGYNFINWHNGSDAPFESSSHVDGYVGGGEVYLISGGCTITGSLSFNGNSCFFHLAGLVITDPGGGSGLDNNATCVFNASRHIEVFDCRIQTNSNAPSNIQFLQGSEGNVYRSQLDGGTVQCIFASEGSVVRCEANAGVGVTNSYKASASVIFSTGQGPTGGTGSTSSGQVFTAGTTPALASTGAGTAGPSSTKVTKSFNAVASGSYNVNNSAWAPSGQVYQGNGPGFDVSLGVGGGTVHIPGGNYKGLWRYPDALFNAITGKTIDAAFITIRRQSNGGSSGPQNIYLASFDVSTFVSNPGSALHGPTLLGTLAWGATKTFKIPAAIIADLQTSATGGTATDARCLGVAVADGHPFVSLAGVSGAGAFTSSGRLRITYH